MGWLGAGWLAQEMASFEFIPWDRKRHGWNKTRSTMERSSELEELEHDRMQISSAKEQANTSYGHPQAFSQVGGGFPHCGMMTDEVTSRALWGGAEKEIISGAPPGELADIRL